MDLYKIERPFFGMVEITARCNSRCAYCYCWKTPHNAAEMSPDMCRVFFPHMVSLGVRKLILTGGEPLLRDDLEEIIQIAYTNRLHTSIVTNGLTLTNRRLSTLTEAGLLGITFSLDSLDPDSYQELRGVPFKRVQNALSILSRPAREGRLAVSINCVLTSVNYRHVPQLVQYATEENIPVMIQPCNTDSRSEMAHLLPDTEQIPSVQTVIDALIDMKQKGAMLLNSASFLRNITQYWAGGSVPPASGCHYGYANITVKHNGDIVPCWRLPAVGNLHSEFLIDIWHSERFAQWRQKMVGGRCPGCWLSCSFDWQTLWHTEEQVDLFWKSSQPQSEPKAM